MQVHEQKTTGTLFDITREFTDGIVLSWCNLQMRKTDEMHRLFGVMPWLRYAQFLEKGDADTNPGLIKVPEEFLQILMMAPNKNQGHLNHFTQAVSEVQVRVATKARGLSFTQEQNQIFVKWINSAEARALHLAMADALNVSLSAYPFESGTLPPRLDGPYYIPERSPLVADSGMLLYGTSANAKKPSAIKNSPPGYVDLLPRYPGFNPRRRWH